MCKSKCIKVKVKVGQRNQALSLNSTQTLKLRRDEKYVKIHRKRISMDIYDTNDIYFSYEVKRPIGKFDG